MRLSPHPLLSQVLSPGVRTSPLVAMRQVYAAAGVPGALGQWVWPSCSRALAHARLAACIVTTPCSKPLAEPPTRRRLLQRVPGHERAVAAMEPGLHLAV